MRQINLPPEKTLPFRGGIIVVIVVKAFAKREQRDQEIVATFVIDGKAVMPNILTR